MRFVCFAFLLVFALGCNNNNVTTDQSLEKYFKAVNSEGCFGIYNNNSNQFTVYNLSRFKDSAYLPAQTFDVVLALIGLDKGVIDNENSVDDSLAYTANGGSITMKQAIQTNADNYFVNTASRLGKNTLQFWIDSLAYGQRYSRPKIDSAGVFWMNNKVQITADEQMGLVKRLYFDQLPFQKRTQRIVKESMTSEKNANYNLVYKTGLGRTAKGNLAWAIGWIEENRHPYFFSMNFNGRAISADEAPRLMKNILMHLGYMQGRK